MPVTHDNDNSQPLAEAVKTAAANGTPLAIAGGGTKGFYAGEPRGKKLDVIGHRGIVNYEPTELVISARAGTPLSEIEAALAEKGQMLGFEPPWFGGSATLGGAIACGFSGPRRPYSGSARDFVLGSRIINGRGEILRFGGEVMKNVAGYDVSRLMVGALGTLGVLLEVSLKVLPKPAKEITLCYDMPADKAIHIMNQLGGQPLPLSAACHVADTLYMRISGTELGVRAAQSKLGGRVLENDAEFWRGVREQQHGFFHGDVPLWRLSLPSAAPLIDLPGRWFLDWGGAQRWLKSEAPFAQIRAAAQGVGGYASLFRGPAIRATPSASAVARLQQNLRQAFNPGDVLNSYITQTENLTALSV